MLKRLLDILVAATALIIASPLFLILCIAIKLDSNGPILFRQRRLGLAGREFVMLKFRSMVDNAEKLEGGLFTYDDDPRVTRVGRFLRNTSLDELPQLLNIILGQMSCVGPRPPVYYELGRWDDLDDVTKRRFDVKPGVTGLAQISGRNALSWDEKIVLDNCYIDSFQKWGIFLDVSIMVRTVFKILSNEGSVELAENAKRDGQRQDLSMKDEP